MSILRKECPRELGAGTKIRAYDECGGVDFLLDADQLPTWPEMATDEVIANSPAVKALQADIANWKVQDTNLASQIGEVASRVSTVYDKLDELEEDHNSQDSQIDEINSNISMLKWWNVRQDSKIKALWVRVINDQVYNNFQERLESVYLPQADAVANKYHRGDIYINSNPSIAATNATYINVRGENDTSAASASDRQEVYYSSPADVLTLLGIDPIEIEHPFKHEWIIKVNPLKLEKMISELETLDLSDVIVSLGEVRGEPVFSVATTFEENVTCEKWLSTVTLSVSDNANIDKAVVRTLRVSWSIVQPVTFDENVRIQESLVVDNAISCKDITVTHKATIEEADINHLRIPGYSNDLQWIISDIYSKI